MVSREVYGKKRRRLLRRVMWWGLILVALVVPLAGYIAWQQPVSARWVHERVMRRLQEAAQVPVSYDTATLRLGRGWYEIKNLRFASPDGEGEPMLAIRDVQVRVDPISLLRGSRASIKSIELNEPSSLEVEYQSTGITLGPRTQFLADAIQRLQGDGDSDTLHLPFDLLTIKEAKVRFFEIRDNDGSPVRAASPAVVLSGDLALNNKDAGMLVSFSGTGYSPTAIAGEAGQVPVAPDLELQMHVTRANGELSFRAQGDIAHVSLTRLFASAPGSIFAATNLRFQTELVHSNASLEGSTRISFDGIDLTHPGRQIDIHDNNAEVVAKGRYSFKMAALEFDEIQVNSRQAQASARGMITLSSDHAFDGSLNASRIGSDYRRLLTRLLPEGYMLQGEDTSLNLDVAAKGNRAELAALDGQLDLTSVTLQVPNLARPVRQLGGQVRFGQDRVQFHDLRGHHGQTSLLLTGELTGPYLRKREGDLTLQWSATSTADDLLALIAAELQVAKAALPRRPVARGPASQGTISGAGTYRQRISLANPENMPPPEIDGAVELANVGLSHPALPMPVDTLSGRLNIDGDRLLIEELHGSTGVGEVVISGQVKGNQLFWKDPTLSATILSRSDLARLGDLLSEDQKRMITQHKLRGQALSTLDLRGPLTELNRGAGFTGNMRLRNVAFAPGLGFMEGEFTDVDAEVRWDGKALRLGQFTGKINGETLDAAGVLSPERIALDLHGRADLASISKTFPEPTRLLEMSGPISYSLHFVAGEGEPSSVEENGFDPLPGFDDAATGQLGKLLDEVAARLEQAVATKQYNLTGEVEMKGANIRHRAMPPERKEAGRTIARGEVKNIQGTAMLDGTVFRVSDENVLTCEFADTKDCRLSGELELRPDNLPRMAITLSCGEELRLDSWIVNWGDDLPRPPQPSQTGKRFDLVADIQASRILYKGLRAGRSQATIDFTLIQDNTPRRTVIRDLEIRGGAPGQGSVTGGGEINSFVWNKQAFPNWNTRVQVDRMPLETLLNATFSEPTTLVGMASGAIELRGVGKDAARIQGTGAATLTNLLIGRTPVMQQVGAATGRSIGGTLFQTAESARFEIGNGALSSRNLQLHTNGMRLDIRGDYYFGGNPRLGIAEKTINGLMRFNFFESVLGRIPLLGDIAQLADRVAGTMLLAFRVSGTADRPEVNPVPLPLFTGALPPA